MKQKTNILKYKVLQIVSQKPLNRAAEATEDLAGSKIKNKINSSKNKEVKN